MEKYQSHTYEGGDGKSPGRPDIRKNYHERFISIREQELMNTAEAKEAMLRVREVLDTINQDVLFSIFREYYGRSGNNVDSLALTNVEDIDVFYDPAVDRSGGHHLFGKPEINAGFSSVLSDDLIVNVAIHEYIHEMTSSPFTTKHYEIEGEKDRVLVEDEHMLGVSQFIATYERDNKTGLADTPTIWKMNEEINEGITQILADDIHAEYNRRVGSGSQSPERKNREKTGFSPESYYFNQLNVRLYVALLSVDTGIPEDMVLDAVTKAYFRNADIAPEEIGFLLEEDISKPNEHFRSLLKKRLDKSDFIVFAEHAAECLAPDKRKKLLDRCNELYQKLGDSLHAEYRANSTQ